MRDITDYNAGFIPDEVHTLEEYYNLDNLAKSEPYYAIYGTFKMNIARGPIKIFETEELRMAIFIVEQLSGNKVIEDEIYR